MKYNIGILVLVLLFLNSTCEANEVTKGEASWYSRASCIKESGQCTMANGKELNDEAFTCASWFYPFGTRLLVTNTNNGANVIVVVTDRGPAKRLVKKGRIIDLSKASFNKLASLKQGLIQVTVEVLN